MSTRQLLNAWSELAKMPATYMEPFGCRVPG